MLLDGEPLADSRRPKTLFETSLPPRYYLPGHGCPHRAAGTTLDPVPLRLQGTASYWHVRIGGRVVEDLAWSYPDSQHDGEPVCDLLCFFNERVDIELAGHASERPVTRIVDRGRQSGLVS